MKQEKVLIGIVNSLDHGQDSTGMHRVKTNPNDECYTSMQDILNELAYWGELGKFRGKRIICPCDWDIVDGEDIFSITIEYQPEEIQATVNNVYKAVKSVEYEQWEEVDLFSEEEPIKAPEYKITKINLAEDEIEGFLRNKLTCNFLRTFTQKARAWGIKSITASGYDPATKRGISFEDVDYYKYDVCCTNPPFSMYKEFMKTVVGKIDFIVLAPFLNRVNPNIGLPLMLNEAYLGTSGNTNSGYLALDFLNPTAENAYKVKKVACDWITSFSEAQDERNKILHGHITGIDYEVYAKDYIEMPEMTMLDGSHPIRVPADGIPDNYTGWMFASANILTKVDLSEYEWYGTNFKGYYNKTNPGANPFSHEATDDMVKNPVNGKGFHGIVFRRKK